MSDRDREPTFAERCRGGEATTPVSVRVPDALLDDLDDLWEDAGFESRSAFVRALLRSVADRPEEVSVLTRDGAGDDR